MIYYFNEPKEINRQFIEKATALMPPERAKRAGTLVNTARAENAVSFALLMYALNAEYGMRERICFSYGKNGKPGLVRGEPFFSLSHCDRACVCCLSDEQVGVDLQKIEPGKDRCASRVCCDKELEAIGNGESFIRLWTQKESLIKRFSLNLGAMKTLPDLSKFTRDDTCFDVCGVKLLSRRVDCFYLSVCGKPETDIVSISAKQLEDFLKRVDY